MNNTQTIKLVCHPCEFHKLEMSFHSQSESYRAYACTHPNAYPALEKGDSEIEELRQKVLEYFKKSGRFIGKTENCPDWCPLNESDSR